MKSDSNKVNSNTIYVAVDGKDYWSGFHKKPLMDGSDGPLATLYAAKQKIRELQGNDMNIFIREGVYFIDETVVFSIQDGRRDGKITYSAYPGEKPIFSSGITLHDWEICTEVIEGLPSVAEGKVYRHKLPLSVDKVHTMYDGRQQLTRSHGEFFMPQVGHDYERTDSLNVAKEEERLLLRRVDFEKGQLREWPNVKDIELRFMPVPWTMNLLPLESVDEKSGVAWLQVEATAPLCAKPAGIRVENAIDHMNTPGRWCVNSLEGNIYYWPKEGKPSDDIVVPSLQEYIRVEGKIDYEGTEDLPVENLQFDGLTFMYGKVDRTDSGYKGLGIQHDWEMFDKGTSLVRFRGARDCSITNCHFHTTSGGAIRLDLYCQHIRIENNLIDQIGAMGILLCGYGPGTKDVNNNNIIRNNILSRCGEEIWHGHGIFLWQSGKNIIEHNRIHHTARKAIGLCGVRVTILREPSHKFDEAVRTIRWEEINTTIDEGAPEDIRYLPYLHTRDNLVQNNEVYRVLEKLSDGSALNISGAGEGNNIRCNYLHHIATTNASGVMRVDDWQRGTVFQGNVIYKSNISGIVRKNYNHIIGNVMVDCNCVNGYLKFASYPGESAAYGSRIEQNVFYDSGDEALFFGSGYLVSDEATLPENCVTKNNIYYIKESEDKGQNHVDSYNAKGLEQGSIAADPCFMDLEAGDLRFKENSPVFKKGVTQIDLKKMGITADFPEKLLAYVYHEEEDRVYDRGLDPLKESYEWW